MDIHHLLAICITRDLLMKRLTRTKPWYRRRTKLAIAELNKQQDRVTVGLPRRPHSHGYGLPVGLWRDVDVEQGWL